jgi:hypothetical protein
MERVERLERVQSVARTTMCTSINTVLLEY